MGEELAVWLTTLAFQLVTSVTNIIEPPTLYDGVNVGFPGRFSAVEMIKLKSNDGMTKDGVLDRTQ